MRGTMHDLIFLWMTLWSRGIQEACVWIREDGPPLSGKAEDKLAPNWVRPLFLQRWVTRAIVARLAWLAEHPRVPRVRFGKESKTDWEQVRWTIAEGWCLRE